MCLTLLKAKLRTIEFAVRKGLLIEKEPAGKMGDLTPQPISESIEFRLLYRQRKGKWEGQQEIDQCRHLGASRDLRKIVLVEVSQS